MPHVSKHPLSPKAEKELVRTLEIVLTKVTKEIDMNGFLLALLSPTERVMIAKRLAMIVLLKGNTPDASIAEILHVTRGTVAKMRLFFEARGQGFDVVFKVLENEKLMVEIRSTLIGLAKYSIKAAGGRL